jgi:hypothetical protein
MKKFIITEEERSRILGMHKSAISRQYLKEDNQPSDPEWVNYVNKLNTNPPKDGSYLQTYYTITPEEAKKGNYGMAFMVTSAGGIKDNSQYYYQCINSQTNDFKVGQVYDSDFKLKPKIIADLDAGKTEYRKLFTKGCQATYQYQKVDPQVAAAQAKAKADAEATTNKEAKAKADAENNRQAALTKSADKTATAKGVYDKLLADVNFLNRQNEKEVLDNQVKQLQDFIMTYGNDLPVENKDIIKQKVAVLLKYKPEYYKEPYFLSKDPF